MTVVAQILLSDPKPLAIWVVLILSAMLAFTGLARPDLLPSLRPILAVAADRRDRRDQRRRQAADSVRYADELAMAGRRAAQTADRWHTHWEETERQAATALQAWQDAEQRLTRLRAAAVFTMPVARTPGEYADRERLLHRTVRVAVDRGDLPATALADALSGRRGFNPGLHPADQELAVLQAVTEHRRHQHRQAAAAEQAAWHDARLARSSRESLRRAASAALAQAAAVRHLVPPTRAPIVPNGRLAGLPRIA
jgi:hypothetical protein